MSSGSCEGVIGEANTKLFSFFMGSGPPSQGVTDADLKSAPPAAGTTAEVMQLSRYHLSSGCSLLLILNKSKVQNWQDL